jgi:hypothetical protein
MTLNHPNSGVTFARLIHSAPTKKYLQKQLNAEKEFQLLTKL